MKTSKGIGRFLSYLVPLLLAGALNLVKYQFVPLQLFGFLHAGVVSSILIETVYLQWFLSVRRRFPQKQMRRHVAVFAVLFMLLSLLRVIKYCFVSLGSTTARYLWYAYYIPLIFGPLFMVYASLYFGKPDNYVVSKKWRLLLLPAVLLTAGIFTNDLQQWAFRFPEGLANWETYTHGWLYFAVAVWVALTLLAIVFLAARSMFSRRLLKRAWIPAAVFGGILVYYFLYLSTAEHSILQSVFGMNDFICVSGIAIWESLVAARIIVSNTDHPAIFAVSSLNAGLADHALSVRQRSQNAVLLRPETLRAAQKGEVQLDGGNMLLKERTVQGGWFYWTEDISELRRLNETLKETAEGLKEENAMLRVAAEMDDERRATIAQTQLYDSMTASLRPQLEKLDAWTAALPKQETAYRDALRRCGVLLAYCKRRSNLLLQAQTHPVLTGEELRQCFEESAVALQLAQIPCEIATDASLRLSAENAAVLYETFERVLELVLPALRQMSLTLTAKPDGSPVFLLTLALDRAAQTLHEQLQQTAKEAKHSLETIAAHFVLALKTAKGDEMLCD